MSTEDTARTVLFADLCRSTGIYEALGDETARTLVTDTLGRLATVAVGHRGTVVKSIGDELMCTFVEATHAVEAAIEMNRAADGIRFPQRREIGPLTLHTGLHHGPVVLDRDDVFGDAVNVAARIVSLAKPRQILTTGPTVAGLSPALREMLRCVDRTALRGKSEQLEIHEIVWEWEEATVLADSTTLPHLTEGILASLELCAGERRIRLDVGRPSASLGRHLTSDLMVEGPRVSRQHARVERRRGKFVLIDRSSNGTYITVDGRTVRVYRDEAVLEGAGVLGLGEEVDPESPMAIRFEVRS